MQLSNFFNRKQSEPISRLKKPSRIKSAVLLLFSLSLLVSALVLRFFISSDEEKLEKMQPSIIEAVDAAEAGKESISKISKIENIGYFERQVSPVSFDDIILEKRTQHIQFKDAEYVVARRDAWTIQIMDVMLEEVILDYLSTAEKAEQYAYFRYIAADKSKRYVLIFDDFNNKTGAEAAIAENEFLLPASVKPFARSFKDYVGTVDAYHLQRSVRDLNRSRKREVVLRKTAAPAYRDSAFGVPIRKRPHSMLDKQSGMYENAWSTQSSGSRPANQQNSNKQDVLTNESLSATKNTNPSQPKDANKVALDAKPKADKLSDLINEIEQ